MAVQGCGAGWRRDSPLNSGGQRNVGKPLIARLTCIGAAGLLRHLAADVDFSCEPHHCNNGAHMMQAG